MPITRSVRKSKKPGLISERNSSVEAQTKPESKPILEPEPMASTSAQADPVLCKEGSVSMRSRSGKSSRSKKSVQRAEALKRLAEAKLEEAQAATALAEAEVARIDAQDSDFDDDARDLCAEQDKTGLVKKWLNTQPNEAVPFNCHRSDDHRSDHTELQPEPTATRRVLPEPQAPPQMIDVTSLTAALTEAIRATAGHAPLKYLQELPFFSGDSGEWLAFKAAYRDTSRHFSKTENLVRLRKCLRGIAKEAAISLFVAETEPDEIMRLLEIRFGRPDALVIAEMEKLKALSRLTDNPRDICIFASRISNIVAVVQALKRTFYLYNPEAVRLVVDKMTAALRYRWYDYAAERPEDEPDLMKLSSFLSREAELCSRYAQAENTRDRSPQPHKKVQRAYAATPSESPAGSSIHKSVTITPACLCCKSGHDIRDCTHFKTLKITERWERAKKINACFRCLKKRNYRHRCSYKACGIDECKGSHHPLLHNVEETSHNKKIASETDSAIVTSTRPRTLEKTFLKVIPVKIRGPTATLDTFALLDDGSTITLLEDEVAQAVGATGPREPFEIEGIAGARVKADSSMRVTLSIRGRDVNNEFEFTARTIDHLHLSPQTIDETAIKQCTHLQEVTKDLIYNRGKPTLLIGQDNWNLIVSKSIRSGVRGQPVASLTELGWVLHGPGGNTPHRLHFVSKITVHNNVNEDRMEQLMKNFFDLDAIGIEPKRPKNNPNERALAILEEKSRRLPNGRFETGLLWRNNEVTLPDSKITALRRLEGIEKKLDKNFVLKRLYKEQISHWLDSGYAEVVDSPPCPKRTWYLPHFAVVNHSKPKPRIVLDAACKTNGMSLNDALLSGPDLLQSLPGVLMRFRQRSIAVTGDIKEMFLRIGIRKEDRDALRILWRDDRREGPPTEYRMCSVIFGAASSPCTAIYIKNKNAEEYRQDFPEAADAIYRNHYMDDYLQSFDSIQEAIKIASDVSHVHRQATFCLQKWASNRVEVLKALAPEQISRSKEIELGNGQLTERALGLIWKPDEDELAFNIENKRFQIDTLDSIRCPTKREALRIIMSLYDPLGFATPVTMPAKRLLQDTWRLGVEWDDELPEDLHMTCVEWLKNVKQLRLLTITRCYPYYATAEYLEMHTFVDASESSCIAAVYWRAVTEDNIAHLSLAMAKGKVAPLKTTSIPRLELQAAVLGCRLARSVETEHDLKPSRRVFWTDSRTVLAWLRAGPRAYKPFVAHRVAEIEEDTKVSEWRWLPSACNVADDATRNTPSGFSRDHRWFRGPDFLYLSEESWPREPESTQLPVTGEERVNTTRCSIRLSDALPDATRFSSWLRLVRATGRLLQFIELCRARHTTTAAGVMKRTRRNDSDKLWKKISPRRSVKARPPMPALPTISNRISPESHHILAAEKLWWKAAQQENFSNELYRLGRNLPLERDSKLRTLSVMVDGEGVIRLKSRIDDAYPQLPEEQCNPPVLDGSNNYVRLYIAWVHRQNHHAGTETIVNEIRSRLWVLRLRPTTRSVLKSCIKCRILRGKPASPSTGNHPMTRLAHHQRPFSFVGLDYFGPYSVTVGRRHEKRYVALFTCLTTRAIHLEVAGSLSTDSAIMALRRMMARRGCPAEIHSDNGTNLRGADAELRKAAYDAIKEEASSRTIRWRYLPAASPFFGGAWERLIQCVKRALAATLNERHPTEEVLWTLLLEAEYTVNNRPLTPVSTSADDPESLTPLHFILGGPARVPQPGSFSDSDLNAKQRWRHTQRLADIFWLRWVREYAPHLQARWEPQGKGSIPQIGDVVMLIDENLPRNTWVRGQVSATFPGKDGIVRVVEVRTKSGRLRRAVKKVIVLASEVN